MPNPLTTAELEAMDHSLGATWPRGVMLVCNCGKIGPPTVVEGHRGRSGNLLCRKKPEAFLTVEDAQERAVEVETTRAEAERDRVAAAIDLVEEARNEETPEPSAMDPPKRPRGRPRGSKTMTTNVRGDGRQPTHQRSEQLGPATVRISVEMEAKGFARYDTVRRDPQFGFVGDPGDYLNRCEEALWQVIDWLAAGQQGPISIRLAA
jgi:hypothetical protein